MSEEKPKKTVGAISSELLLDADDQHSVVEQMEEQLSEWDVEVFNCVEAHKKVWPNKDFYIIVITKAERLMPNVFRNYFLARLSCPTPDYDQVVYKYDKASDIVNFVWVIPSRDACIYLKEHALEVAEEERDLLEYVLKFSDGTLWKVCKQLNGEELWY